MNELKALSVMYAEDEDYIRELVGRLLKRRVGSLFMASNGREGLDIIRNQDPQMIITDIEMPEMDGLEMIQKVRMEYDHTRPIIVLTAYKDESHYTEAADAYLYKPVDVEQLFGLMTDLARKYGFMGSENPAVDLQEPDHTDSNPFL